VSTTHSFIHSFIALTERPHDDDDASPRCAPTDDDDDDDEA